MKIAENGPGICSPLIFFFSLKNRECLHHFCFTQYRYEVVQALIEFKCLLKLNGQLNYLKGTWH